jgi:phosphomannomutase / phosphoglucomutase
MQDHIFRTYDIRGKVGSELSIDQVRKLGRAIAFYYKQQDPSIQTIAVGMDGRVHSPAIKKELVAGLQESGFDVVFIGVCPSPTLYFSEYWLGVDAALMITASHNPQEYNGIKICMRTKSVFGPEIKTILEYFKQDKQVDSNTPGSYSERLLAGEHVEFLKRLFPHLVGIDVNAVFDCGNGATGAVVPELIKQMEWKRAYMLCADVDGSKAVHEADPTVDANVADVKLAMQEKKAILGIAFDGDGDRMGALTSAGDLVAGDKLLTLYSHKILQELPRNEVVVVYDVKCSNVVKQSVEQRCGSVKVAPSGHAFIKKYMQKEDAVLGGELSCHFFFHDRYFGFDDGVYAALRLIELLVQSKKTLSELLEIIPHRESSPEFRIACKQGEGPIIVEKVKQCFSSRKDVEITTIDGVRVDTQDGWGLVRASNTQPAICIRFESNSTQGLLRIRESFIKALEPCFEPEFIKKKVTWPGI